MRVIISRVWMKPKHTSIHARLSYGDERCRLVAIQIDTAELVNKLRRCAALAFCYLPLLPQIDCITILQRTGKTVRDASPACFATAACLLPPAADACYICCCRLFCENQARGRSGLEAILGRI